MPIRDWTPPPSGVGVSCRMGDSVTGACIGGCAGGRTPDEGPDTRWNRSTRTCIDGATGGRTRHAHTCSSATVGVGVQATRRVPASVDTIYTPYTPPQRGGRESSIYPPIVATISSLRVVHLGGVGGADGVSWGGRGPVALHTLYNMAIP